MATNPNNAIGTNAAYSGRTSPNAFNDVLAMFSGRGILNGWEVLPSNNMVITLGGQSGVRDVAIAEDNAGNKITINNISQQPVEVEIQAASTTSASTDYIVAYVNNPPEGQALLADNPGACGLIDVRGSGNLAPTEEQIRAAITADGAGGTTAYYVILATISIPIAATTITATNITQGGKSHSVDWATLDGRVTNLETYSTEEKVVGIWVDGKPIYRKTVLKSDGVSSGENNIAHNIENLGQVIRRDLSFYNSVSGDSFLPPAFNTVGNRQEMSGWTVNRTQVKIFSTFAYSNPLYITLEYTKTTD